MFPLLRKNLLFLSSRCSSSSSSSSQVRTFLIRFPFSSPPPPPQPDSRSVRVSVWWDVDNCGVPSGISYWNVAPAIFSALRSNGIKGAVDIDAYYKDSTNLSDHDSLALISTGIMLHPVGLDYIPHLEEWVASNPPPKHLFLITGDRCDSDLSRILHQLRMKNYNILIACPGRGSDILRSATTIMWQWSSMLNGQDLTAKHFNYPPYGQLGSWYGESKVPLENPFSPAEESISSPNAEILEDLKSGEVSKATLENPFSAVEEPTSSKEQGGPASEISKVWTPGSKASL